VAHGTGENLQFPTKQQIEAAMVNFDAGHFVGVYGDGSLTNPTCWWAALGGFGTWMPKRNFEEGQGTTQEEKSTYGGAVGQTGSSTRMELLAWLTVLAEPIRSIYATDSAAMMGKAIKLIEAAKAYENRRCTHSPRNEKNPIGKPWGLQADGDLWEQAWLAILRRGAANQKLRKVKGHATSEDVEAGRSTAEDRIGNDKSDTNADKGVQSIAGDGLVKLAGWAAKRQATYKKFIARIHRFIAAITTIEKEKRERKQRISVRQYWATMPKSG